MSAVFSIQSPDLLQLDATGCTLYLDLAGDHLAYAVLQHELKEFLGLGFYSFSEQEAMGKLQDVLLGNELFRKKFREVKVQYNFAESLFVPVELYNPSAASASLDLLFGDLQQGLDLVDDLNGHGVKNVYRVPAFWQKQVSDLFQEASCRHSYSLLLDLGKLQAQTGEQMEAIFYPNRLVVSVSKEGKLVFVRSFLYETAEDVAYHVLNTARQFNLDPAAVILRVSGLIDEQSSTFSELMKYFLQIELVSRPAEFRYHAQFNDHPSHFFTPVFNMAVCE